LGRVGVTPNNDDDDDNNMAIYRMPGKSQQSHLMSEVQQPQ